MQASSPGVETGSGLVVYSRPQSRRMRQGYHVILDLILWIVRVEAARP